MSIISDATVSYRITRTEYNLSDVEDFPDPPYRHSPGGRGDEYNEYRNQLKKQMQERVRALDPNNGRCLVENVAEHAAVSFCYCSPPHPFEEEPRLYRVVLEHGIFHVEFETSRNVFRVGAAIKQLYEKHYWVLLPIKDIINKYHSVLTKVGGTWTAHRETFPVLPDHKDFEYRVIPISDKLKRISINHQLNHPKSIYKLLSPDDFLIFVYPFADIPVLKSHVHPRFAVLGAGRKLTKRVSSSKLQGLLEEFPLLKKVVQIYEAWTAPRPENSMDDPSYYTLPNGKSHSEPGVDDQHIPGYIEDNIEFEGVDSDEMSIIVSE